MNRTTEPKTRADKLTFPDRLFLGIVLTGAVLLAAVTLTFDRDGKIPLFLNPPYVFVSIIAACLLLRFAASIAGWMIGGNAPARLEMTRIDAVLVAAKFAAMLALTILGAFALLSLPFHADLSYALFHATISLLILSAMMTFLIPAVRNTELVLDRLREKRGAG